MKKVYYQNALDETKQQLTNLAKAHKQISWIRLISFLLSAGIIIFAVFERLYWLYGIGAAVLVVFIVFVFRHRSVESAQRLQTARKLVLEKYLARFDDSWRLFGDNGQEFLTDTFPQGLDLDVFGKNSLFQYLSTAHTERGRKKLAMRLSNLSPDKSDIEKHQAAVRELGDDKEFSVHFESLGLGLGLGLGMTASDYKQKPDITESFLSLVESPIKPTSLVLVFYSWGLPALTVSFLLFAFFGFNMDMNIALFGACFVLSLASTYIGLRRNGKILKPVEDMAQQIEGYSNLLKAIEQKTFDNSYLCELQTILSQNGGVTLALRQLNSICESAKGRRNIYGFILFNGLLLWDFHLTDRFLAWRGKYGGQLRLWLDVIGEFEMLSSLAVLCHVKEQYNFPEIVRSKMPKVEFGCIKHPLITESKSVGNDLDLSSGTCIITGSNMSGKTTFLRSVGINILLAYAGAPVSAKSFAVSELAVYTSIRLSDSVTDGISAFYAELLRLRDIVEYHKTGRPMLILIDEIFKGTNSGDRITGARETVKRLSGDMTITLFTTHDFELCDIEHESGIRAINYHFEEQYDADKILFDYKIRSGRCKTTNAQYLLKMTGII